MRGRQFTSCAFALGSYFALLTSDVFQRPHPFAPSTGGSVRVIDFMTPRRAESADVDASMSMIPLVGFRAVSDPRVAGTVKAIEQGLLWNGFVGR